jgi:class 3 adenylate cyclase
MADFPSGTVTFLFTDIEGSTALWECEPVAMASAVRRHLSNPARCRNDRQWRRLQGRRRCGAGRLPDRT